ncbi:hypothetical protein [Zunongwangia sp. HGR-M22]|uniref:hypothetical protein n=1 Tax=Zunongwangia sp. HGR-M22 TaxID=3015168 RepID=UPI0022DDB231|nr:hypothetical protein [Zunongwangia sp. HGR-M22]WBL25093.1 hypothetical protein PBT91_14465 [Zunongwangia sp. HGR-M22]
MKHLLNLVQENSKKTGNFSGISEVRLAHTAKIPFNQTRQILTRLVEDKKVLITEGINHKLVFAI